MDKAELPYGNKSHELGYIGPIISKSMSAASENMVGDVWFLQKDYLYYVPRDSKSVFLVSPLRYEKYIFRTGDQVSDLFISSVGSKTVPSGQFILYSLISQEVLINFNNLCG